MRNYEVGERVKLAPEEGLDLPPEWQGHVGIVIEVRIDAKTDWHSYTVRMPDGTEVNCECYHLDEVVE
jgi:hypothetical protein